MKKLFLTILAALAIAAPATLQAQEATDSLATKKVYCLLLGFNKNILGIGNKISVQVDFGEESNFWGNDGRDVLIGDDGKDLRFNSMVDAMNFMAGHGWEFEDAYVITIGNQLVYHWLMSKEVSGDDNGRSDLRQRRDKKKDKKKKKEKAPVKDYDDIY